MSDEHRPLQAVALQWGVKQSFRNYVEAAGGVIAVRDGADRTAEGEFTFTPGPGEGLSFDETGRPMGVGRFQGLVQFDAHGGMLAVCLADPVLEIGASEAAITVADSPARTRRIAVAHLDLPQMTMDASGEIVIPAALSMDGIQWLGDHYPLKTPLDPVRLIVRRP